MNILVFILGVVSNRVMQETSWLVYTLIIGLIVAAVWKLSSWGAIRKVEKEVLPTVESKLKEVHNRIEEVEGRRSMAVRDLHSKREQTQEVLEHRVDTYRQNSLELYHKLEIENTRMHERMDNLREFTSTMMVKIEEVDRKLEQRIAQSEAAIMNRLTSDQNDWKEAIAELKNEIRASKV